MFYFESLIVYQKAFSLNQKIYRFIKKDTVIPFYKKNQLGRAADSVMLNIAEGTGRRTIMDRRNFLVISRGSTLECASLINFLIKEGDMPVILGKELYEGYDEISKILYAMIRNAEKKK